MYESNQEWLHALQSFGTEREKALTALRDYLFRVALLYLSKNRSDLAHMNLLDIRHLAEDLAQEATLSVQKNLSRFRGESKFTSWAYRIVINLAISELRRRRYQTRSLEHLSLHEQSLITAIFGRPLEVEQAAELEGVLADLQEIVHQELTERQRQAIQMVHFEGMAIAEVADEFEISANALYKLLYDGRQKIKAQLLMRYQTKEAILRLIDDLS